MSKIFCIGFPKTGTTSLEEALTILGYNVCKGHYNNNHTNYLIGLFLNKDYKEIDRIIGYYDVFADLPFGGTDFYIYLSNKYPNAKFIYTHREASDWYGSLERMMTKLGSNLEVAMEDFHKNGRYGLVYYLEKVFNIKKINGNRDNIIIKYEVFNNDILTYFQEENYSFLNIKITDGDSWDVLCPFLKKEIPNVKFPVANVSPQLLLSKDNHDNPKFKSRLKYMLLSFFKK